MGMKPRLNDPNGMVAPNLVSQPNAHDGSEENPNIPNTVSTKKPHGNTKLAPNLISGPHTSGK